MTQPLSILSLLAFLLSSCNPAVQVPTLSPTFTDMPPAIATQLPTSTATISPTLDPYYTASIEYLCSRGYGGGQIEFTETIDQNNLFTRYLIRYPSDGLNIRPLAKVSMS